MESGPVTWGLGPVGHGYLYVGDILIGPAEEARLTAHPAEPQPSEAPGFVELSVRLSQRQVARLNGLDRSFSETAQWRFKAAGPAPWSFPEWVIEQGRAALAEDDVLVIHSDWDRVEQGMRPWFVRPSSPPPDSSLLRGPDAPH